MDSVLIAKRLSLTDRISRTISNKRPPAAHIQLSRDNIYVFPTPAGLVFVVLLVILLITAINYQNSLVYLLTFLLGTFFFLSIWLAYLNLSGLQILSKEAGDVFEGEPLRFQISLLHEGKDVPNLYVGSDVQAEALYYLQRGQAQAITVSGKPDRRGVYRLPRLYLATRFPFGLIRAWTWLRTEAKVYVYPRPIEPLRGERGGQSTDAGRANFTVRENSGDLKLYAPGDSLSRVAWKQFASKDELYIRAYDTSAQIDDQWVRWADYHVAEGEQRLAMMVYDVLRLHGQKRRYGMSLPGIEVAPSLGQRHTTDCLRQLACFGRPLD